MKYALTQEWFAGILRNRGAEKAPSRYCLSFHARHSMPGLYRYLPLSRFPTIVVHGSGTSQNRGCDGSDAFRNRGRPAFPMAGYLCEDRAPVDTLASGDGLYQRCGGNRRRIRIAVAAGPATCCLGSRSAAHRCVSGEHLYGAGSRTNHSEPAAALGVMVSPSAAVFADLVDIVVYEGNRHRMIEPHWPKKLAAAVVLWSTAFAVL